MTDTTLASRAGDTPRPSAADVQQLIARELSLPSRPGHVALLLGSLVGAGVAGALLATEAALPLRTRIALTLMVLIGLSWTSFAVWVLRRRGLLLAKRSVIAGRMAVAFTALFTVGVWAVGRWSATGRMSYAALGVGFAMLVTAIVLLVRAQRRFAALTQRRAVLERQLGGVARSLSIVLALLIAAGGAGAQTVPAAAALITRPGTFPVSGQPIAVIEGRLTVPANRGATSGATLALAFVQIKSTAATPGAPIVFLAGGPGDAGTRAVSGMPMAFLNELLAVADVIAFDQRGTGSSEPRNAVCPPGEILPRDRPGDPAEFLAVLRGRVESCLVTARAAGVDVMGLTTVESADDLEDLRRALGVPKLSLLAGSYGTHLALAMAKRHPGSVDRMALAGVEGLDDTFKLPSRVDSVVTAIAAAKRPTLRDDLLTLRARLVAEPARFTFPTGQTIVLGAWDLQRWVADALDAVPEIDAMVAAVPAMLHGDFTALAQGALMNRLPRPIGLMNLAMDCASYASPSRLETIRREAPTTLLGDAINFPLPGLCDVPGLPRLPDAYRAPWTADVPALLISGTLDGRTPVRNALDAAGALPRSRSLVIPGASHGLFGHPDVMKALLEFFRG